LLAAFQLVLILFVTGSISVDLLMHVVLVETVEPPFVVD